MAVYKNELELTIGQQGQSTGRKVTGIAISAKVEVGKPGRASSADVTVYNLADTSRSALAEAGAWVAIDAIRDGVSARLFVGDVSGLSSEVTGRNIATTFALDSASGGLSKRVSVGYGPNTSLRSIAGELASAAGLPLASYAAQLAPVALGAGWSFRGTVAEALRDACESTDTQWRIVNGGLYVEPQGGERVETGRLFRADSGLIGSPRITEAGGIELVVLLDTGLAPGSFFQVESRLISGAYRATSVTHEAAALMTGPWSTSIEARPA